MLLSEKAIDIRSAEARLPELLDRVEGGEEILISRDGGLAARLIPVGEDFDFQPPGGWDGRIWQEPDRERVAGAMLYAVVSASDSSS
jgi:prevent-host-death family protein